MRRISSLALLALCAISAADEPGIGDSTFPSLGNPGYHASHYNLKLKFDPTTQILQADVTMTAKADTALTAFAVDFHGFQISSLKVDGKDASYERTDQKLKVTAKIDSGKEFTLETVYSGKPEQIASTALPGGLKAGFICYTDGAVAACEPDMAHSWFPCNDHPLNKATFETEIEAPAGYTAIANGVKAPSDHGVKWVVDKPVMTCMETVAIGKYEVLTQPGPGQTTITNYLPPGDSSHFADSLKTSSTFMAYFNSHLGEYPFASYGTIVPPKDLGKANLLMSQSALETTTIPVFGYESANIPSVLIHELAHQWMGDCVSVTNWGKDIWWVEGFAQYTEFLAIEVSQGKPAYDAQVKQLVDHYAAQTTWLKPGQQTPETLFGESTYAGGALTYHALRVKVGDEKFFKIIRTFIDRHKYGNATTDDLIAIATEVAGQDMKPFFQAWLFGDKMPPIG